MITTWPSPRDADLESLELVSRGESHFPMTGRVPFGSGSADGGGASGAPARSSVMGESPAGFTLPSSDRVVRPGSKARAGMRVKPRTGFNGGSEGPSSYGWEAAAPPPPRLACGSMLAQNSDLLANPHGFRTVERGFVFSEGTKYLTLAAVTRGDCQTYLR